MAAIGLDIGGSSVKAAALGPGSEVRTARSAKYARPDAAGLRAAVAEALAGLALLPGDPLPVGVCVPGVFDPAAGAVTLSLNVPGLVGLSLRGEVARAVPGAAGVRVTTDAHAAAIDYHARHAAHGRLLALSLGTGVGACVLDDGEPLRVSGDTPGHLGQLDVTLPEDASNPPPGPDGSAGTLEAYVGAPALRRRFGEGAWPEPFVLSRDDPALRALARALRVAHAIYRPAHVALLGGVGVRLRESLPALHSLVDDRLTSMARAGWTLGAGDDDYHAARGAARLAAGVNLAGTDAADGG